MTRAGTSIDFTLATPSGCWHYAGRLEHMARHEIDALHELVSLAAKELANAAAIEEQADRTDGKAETVSDRGEWLANGRKS